MSGRGKKKLINKKDMVKAEGYTFAGFKNNTICTLMDWEHNFLEDRPDIRKRLTQKELSVNTPCERARQTSRLMRKIPRC